MLPTKLYHYSAEPLKKLRQDFHDMHWARLPRFPKPHGFWVSVEDFEKDRNWHTWCGLDKFRLEGLKYRYHVILKKKAKILYLKNDKELEEFSLKYAGNYDFASYIYIIKWQDLMKEYDGIIIAPYKSSCTLMNLTISWYYPWDCASGCIWNVSAVKSFTLEPIQEKPEEPQVVDNVKG